MSVIEPHGGQLTARLIDETERATAVKGLAKNPRIAITDPRVLSDIELLGVGAVSPLEGFLGPDDYVSVVERMRLQDGTVWSMPITLPVSAEQAKPLQEKEPIALVDDAGNVLARLDLTAKFTYDKAREAEQVFRTTDESHPGVARLMAQGDTLLGGRITVLQLPYQDEFPTHRLTPAQTRQRFADRGWHTVVGFQTRNPIHRAHEYLQKCALEIVDGLLIHPLVGATKQDDVPPDVRMRCYEVLMERYYPKDRTLLSVFPAAMRYAGPREALFHALVRKNYGCSHFIVGRDHAGVGKYYGTYDAQRIFDEFSAQELGITSLCFEHSFFCRACEGMGSAKTCPHGGDERVFMSGTTLREMLANGQEPPHEITRPEVAKILIGAMVTKP